LLIIYCNAFVYANGLATSSSLNASLTTGKMTVKLLAAIYSDWSVNPAVKFPVKYLFWLLLHDNCRGGFRISEGEVLTEALSYLAY